MILNILVHFIEYLLKLTNTLDRKEVREERELSMYKSKIDSFFVKMVASNMVLVSIVCIIPYFIRVINDMKIMLLETVLMFSLLLSLNLFL